MKIIDITNKKPDRLTVMLYGKSRAGKTLTAGTFPRPLFLSDNAEGGWETLRTMDQNLWFEKDRPPEVHALEKPSDMFVELNTLETRVINHPGEIQTLVIDSLTFYADMFFSSLERDAAANPTKSGKVNKFELYTGLASHLRAIMLKAHAMPINVVWIALEKDPIDEANDGGILLAGQMANKSPAACALWLYQRSYAAGQELKFEIRTRRFGSFPAGGRYGNRLPDPLQPSYTALATALGMMEGDVKKVAAVPQARRVVSR